MVEIEVRKEGISREEAAVSSPRDLKLVSVCT